MVTTKANNNKEAQLHRYIELTQHIRELSNPLLGEIGTDDNFRAVMLRNFLHIGELSKINVQILDLHYFPLIEKGNHLSEEEHHTIKEFAKSLVDPYYMDNLDLHLVYQQLDRILQDPSLDDDTLICSLDDFVMVAFSMLYTMVCVHPCSDAYKRYREAGIKAGKRVLTWLTPERFQRIKSDEAKESVIVISRFLYAINERPDVCGDEEINTEELAGLFRSAALASDPFYTEQLPSFNWNHHVFRIYEYLGKVAEFNNARGFNAEQLEEIYQATKRAIEMYASDPAYFSTVSNSNNLRTYLTRILYLTGRLSLEAYKEELVNLFLLHKESETGQPDLSSVMIVAEYLLVLEKGVFSATDAKNISMFYRELILIVNQHSRRGTLLSLMFYLSHILKNFVEVPGGEHFESFCLSLMAALHPPTYVHTRSVASLAKTLTKHLLDRRPDLFVGMPGYKNVSAVQQNHEAIKDYIYHAALCHDFGKLLIIETIRMYARNLLPSEMEMIHLHGSVGAYLLKHHPETAQYADVAVGHHVWFDDHDGYPETFNVEASPYSTAIAIVACADCLDAATDEVGRSYKTGKNFDGFFEELMQGSGTRYAPYLVELLSDKSVRGEIEMLLAKGREDNYKEAFRRLSWHRS